jgi:hypothetical protein
MTRVWIAYYADYSEIVVFDTELDCLRQAVEHSMLVCYGYCGIGIREQTAPGWVLS